MSGFKVVEHKIPGQHIREWPHATAHTQEDQLYLHFKQYIPESNPNPQPGDVTILAAHANGFPKEMYEPLWEDLLAQTSKHGWRIRSIWMADLAHQGQSSVLNENVLGNDPGWFDHSRDLLHMINLKRDEMPRPIFGVGHSVGGAQLTNLSLFHPRLFNGLILIDPVIQPRSAEVVPGRRGLAEMSTFRRALWPSREDAATGFAKSAFYKAWDPRVLERWNQYGLRETPTVLFPDAKGPQVTLTTTAAQEVFTFLRPNYEGYGKDGKPVSRATHADLNPALPHQQSPFYRSEPSHVYERLPEVRPPVLYVFGSTSGVSQKALNDSKVARTGTGVGGSGGVAEGRVKEVTFDGVGHLIAMEAPQQTAVAAVVWIADEMVRYREEMKAWDVWRTKSLREKQDTDDMWKKMMGGPPTRSSKM